MKNLFLMLSTLCFSLKAQNLPVWDWDTIIQSPNNLKIAKDLQSNFYVYDSRDTVKKFSSDKTLLWTKAFPNSKVSKVICSPTGDVMVYGVFTATLQLDTFLVISKGFQDIFICRLNSAGNVTWLKSFGSKSDDNAGGICLNENFIYLTGKSGDTTYFSDHMVPKSNSSDLFVVKYYHSGNLSSVKFAQLLDTIISANGSEGAEIEIDKRGNLLLLAAIHGKVQFDTTVMDNISAEYLLKLDNNLNFNWKVKLSEGPYQHAFNLLADAEDNIYYIYHSSSNHDGGGSVIGKISSSSDILKEVADKYDNNYIVALDKAPDNDIVFTGFSVKRSYTHAPTFLNYLFVGKTNLKENVIWMRRDSSFNSVVPNDIKALDETHILITGNFKDVLFLKDTLTSPVVSNFLAVLKTNTVSGVEKNFSDNLSFFLYPNPSPGKFTISGIPANSKICIYDISGRCVYSQKLIATDQQINISDKEKGIYFLEAATQSGVFRKKLMLE